MTPRAAVARAVPLRVLVAAALLALAVPAGAAADSTPPEIDVAVRGPQGDAGWFTGRVIVNWTVRDPDSTTGFVVNRGCQPSLVFTGDTTGTVSDCHASSEGGSASKSVTVRLDATPPAATAATPSRRADHDGWYSEPVTVAWAGSDATSGVASCTRATYAGPDSATAPLSGTCRDRAGNTSASRQLGLRFDATAPAVTGATPARSPEKSGWFTAPVDLLFAGTDATSGVATCTALNYAGDGPPTGTCTDHAGNTSAPVTAALRYDDQPPALRRAAATWRGSRARVTWRADGAVRARVTRRPGRRGGRSSTVYMGKGSGFTDRRVRRGRRYRYVIHVIDQAGNVTTATARLRRPTWLLAPAHGAKLRRPPVLRWRAVRGASFYNVQLFRGGRKILTRWPSRTRLRLPSLPAGRYRWYVWAAHGTRAAPRYGKVLGRRTFTLSSR